MNADEVYAACWACFGFGLITGFGACSLWVLSMARRVAGPGRPPSE